jgi:hypothetical protein
MEILIKAFQALWQVIAIGLLLGAGLPALFALGVRSLNTGRVLVSAGGGQHSVGQQSVGQDSVGQDGEVTKASPAGIAGAVVCFGICVLAVAFGIVVIIFGKTLFGT